MKPKIIFRKIKEKTSSKEKQSAMAQVLVLQATGERLKHSQTGRPVVNQSMDVSISHKDNLVCVGVVPRPYRIGIDVERVDANLNAELFLGPVINKAEQNCFGIFCEENNLSSASGIAIFWSIKEAFFKCLDYDLKPGKVSIMSIASDGRVIIDYADEIKQLMTRRCLKICSVKASFDQKYSYTQAIMKEN